MRNSEENKSLWILVLVLVCILLLYYLSFGKINFIDKKPNERHQWIEHRIKKIEKLIQSKKALKEKLDACVKKSFFITRIIFSAIYFILNSIIFYLLYKGDFNDTISILLNYNEAVLIIFITICFVKFEKPSNIDTVIRILHLRIKKIVYRKFSGLDNSLKELEVELFKLSGEKESLNTASFSPWGDNIDSIEQSLSDMDLMNIAIEEQNKCTSFPKVGAVVAKNGKILSKAYRAEISNKHAERIAIEKLQSSDLVGAMMVTTLEPCIEFTAQQSIKPCTDLIIENGITKVIIGVLDPNGTIYCEGYKKLLDNSIDVGFFNSPLQEIVDASTFENGDCNKGFGPSGKKWVAVVGSGNKFEIQFSKSDSRSIAFWWQSLQFTYGCVDLCGPTNEFIRCATNMNSFDQITNPSAFRNPRHFMRMYKGNIAVVYSPDSLFIILIKLIDMAEFSICFQWEVREK